jgi:hypothetical protein
MSQISASGFRLDITPSLQRQAKPRSVSAPSPAEGAPARVLSAQTAAEAGAAPGFVHALAFVDDPPPPTEYKKGIPLVRRLLP